MSALEDLRDERGHYLGKKGTPNEHRTVGDYRAWCHACGEWCYPDAPCESAECCRSPEAAEALRVASAWTWTLADAGKFDFTVPRADLEALVRWAIR